MMCHVAHNALERPRVAPAVSFCKFLFHTPFHWGKLLFTIIPVIPFVLYFDGIISVMRTYSTEELAGLARQAGSENFRWEVRQSKNRNREIMTCLIGWPDPEGGVYIVEY